MWYKLLLENCGGEKKKRKKENLSKNLPFDLDLMKSNEVHTFYQASSFLRTSPVTEETNTKSVR